MKKLVLLIICGIALFADILLIAQNRSDIFYAAMMSYRKQNYRKAIKLFNEMLNDETIDENTKYDIYFKLASAYKNSSKFKEAIEYYRKTLETNGKHSEKAKYFTAISNVKLFNSKRAIELLNSFKQEYPKSRFVNEINYFIAKCYENLDDIESAIKNYEILISEYKDSNFLSESKNRIKSLKEFGNQDYVIGEKKKWTLIIYVNADNNLEQSAIEDINEMEMIGSSKDVNVVCLVDRAEGHSADEDNWSNARIYYITKDIDKNRINSKMLKNLDEVDMGSIDELVNFAKFCIDEFPAEKYMIDIWNHGKGWKKRAAFNRSRGISFDDESKNAITMMDLEKGLKEITEYKKGKIDVIGFDACLMAMIEVGYAVKDYAKFMIASENVEPGDGWEYNLVLEKLVEKPDMDGKELANVIVDAYKENYNRNSKTTQSAFDLSKYNELMDSFNIFVESFSKIEKIDFLKKANDIQSYLMKDSKDLYDFCIKLQDMKVSSDLISTIEKLKRSIDDVVISNYCDKDGLVKDSHGIAINLPLSSSQYKRKDYKLLSFANDTKWDEFLDRFLNISLVDNLKVIDGIYKEINEIKKLAITNRYTEIDELSLYLENSFKKLSINVKKSVIKSSFKSLNQVVNHIENVNDKTVYIKFLNDISGFLTSLNLKKNIDQDKIKKMNKKIDSILY